MLNICAYLGGIYMTADRRLRLHLMPVSVIMPVKKLMGECGGRSAGALCISAVRVWRRRAHTGG